MSQQQKSDKTRFQKPQSFVLNNEYVKTFNCMDSSFNQLVQQNAVNKQVTQQVLKRVSQTIVRVHSDLVPKTQKLQIYRDLSRQQHQLLERIKNDPLTHTIYAGIMAIQSCLKQIGKQQQSVMGRLMKGVTVMLGNFKKLQTELMKIQSLAEKSNNNKAQQSMLRLWDSMKMVISDIHKLPTAKIKINEKQKHNELINSIKISDDMLNTINKDQNLLFSLLVQENNHQRAKIVQLEKKLTLIQKQKTMLIKDIESMKSPSIHSNQKPKLSSPVSSTTTEQQNQNNETASESRNTQDSLLLIKQLNQQLLQKNQMIKAMNYQFKLEIEKYDKIFHKLEEENKSLRKYGEIQIVGLVESLEYEINVLRDEKRQYQLKFNQLVNQINSMAMVNSNVNGYNLYDESQILGVTGGLQHSARQRIDTRHNPNIQNQRFYATDNNKRSRCPSISPTNKQQSVINRYFSPTYQSTQIGKKNYPLQKQVINNNRGLYKQANYYEKPGSKYKRDSSPTFGSPTIDTNKQYETQNDRLPIRSNYRTRQPTSPRFDFPSQIPTQVHKSRSKQNPMKISHIDKNQYQFNQLKNEMKRSKFFNQDMVYL